MGESSREEGAAGGRPGHRYRARRVPAVDLDFEVDCLLVHEGRSLGPFPVVDVSSTGLGCEPEDGVLLAPGTLIEELTLVYREAPVWRGSASVVYQVETPSPRIGMRFVSRLLNLELLALSDALIEQRLERELATQQWATRALSAEWRAGVANLRRLFTGVREVLDALEEGLREAGGAPHEDERALLERVHAKWWKPCRAQLCVLDGLTEELDARTRKLARRYASRELLPLLYASPVHGRAYDRPLGHADDHRLRALYFAETLEGETLYARFLHYMAQRDPLGRAFAAREAAIRRALGEALAGIQRGPQDPPRVVALGSGPAVELQRLAATSPSLDGARVLLVDSEEEALVHGQRALLAATLRREPEQPLTLEGLHASVRELLTPESDDERTASAALDGVDIIYSAGLLDILPQGIAGHLVQRLYGAVRPGGRVFLGNLRRVPEASWLMERVLGWPLECRSVSGLRAVADGLYPQPARAEVVVDRSELCMFLELIKPRP